MVAAAAAVLAGCEGSSPTEPRFAGLLEITPDQASYAPGSIVTLTLRNPSPVAVSYVACAHKVEMRLNGFWVAARQLPNFALCAAARGVVEPGQTVVENVLLLNDQAPGTYRVLFVDVTNGPGAGGGIDEPSQTFTVR
ncbi:hypothetical protein [Longimicrobium sp.]|uniref:hypothetical protein n=1 Tax=Longimicrobium sp. TaxID=2029185 RepID=UPI002CC8807A|nr:hypothetical protein [Longimicrobium sp.]HSU16476.1 hypothetical protein [Longimicrobium sp.]